MHSSSGSHETVSKIDHILEYKGSLNKYNKIEITPCISPDNNGIRLENTDHIPTHRG
jgi:hypothetical protein